MSKVITLSGMRMGSKYDDAKERCLKNGGTLKSVVDSAGESYLNCYFKDGSVCDVWGFYQGTCQKGQNFPAGGTEATDTALNVMVSAAAMEDAADEEKPPKLLNYGIAAGAGAAAGLIVVATLKMKPKKGSAWLAGAGIGAAAGAFLLAITWPKAEA